MAAAGGVLFPGLADHPLQFRLIAAARRSIDLAGRPLSGLAPPAGDGVLRVIAGDEVTRAQLPELFGARQDRVQHRSGAVWALNSAALELLPAELSDHKLPSPVDRDSRLWC